MTEWSGGEEVTGVGWGGGRRGEGSYIRTHFLGTCTITLSVMGSFRENLEEASQRTRGPRVGPAALSTRAGLELLWV